MDIDTNIDMEIRFEQIFKEKTGLDYNTEFEKIRPKLVWFLMNMSKDKALAEEITDEAFLKSIEEFDKYFAEKGQYTTWVFTIGRRLMLQRFKDSQKLCSMEEEHNGGTLIDYLEADQTDSYIYENSLNLKMELIKRKIPQLPNKYATVITMRELDGQTYETISNYLNLNLNTVKSRISQGRNMLRKICKSEMDKINYYNN